VNWARSWLGDEVASHRVIYGDGLPVLRSDLWKIWLAATFAQQTSRSWVMNKVSSLIAIALLLLSTATAKSQTIKPIAPDRSLSMPLQDPKQDDSKAAAQVAQKLFAAMKAKDGDAIRALFLKDGQLVAIDKPRTGSGPSTTRVFTGDAFAKLISENKAGDLIEEMKNPEVKIFGDMALVFGRYTFHVGTSFSHCGTNSFQLARTSDGWKIANAASTLEFNCTH
jgi:ketosteroid isomerase-like protein